MRTDATIDRKQVKCPKASTLGFGKWKAQVGDMIVFREAGQLYCGRMLGRIAYAPPCGETPALRGYILATVINTELTHTYERWVNPETVERVHDINEEYLRVREVVNGFLSDELVKAPVDEIRRNMEHGGTLESYRAYRDKRLVDLNEYETRKGLPITEVLP